MKVNQLKAGSFLAYVKTGLTILVNLIYTPAMIRFLGKSEYGLYMTVSSIIAIFSILSLGFNSGYVRYFARYSIENNTNKIYELNGLFLLIFTIIGIIAAICGTFLSFHLDLIFDKGLTAKEYEIARILMLLLTINISLSFPMSVFSTILSANERFIVLNLLAILKTAGGPILSLPLLLLGFKSIALVAVTLMISLISDIVYLFYVFVVLGNRFRFRNFEKNIFKDLFVYTSFVAINIGVDQINWNMGKLLLGRYRGTSDVSVYSVGYTVFSCYMTFSTAMTGVFTPKIHKLVSNTKPALLKSRLTELFTKVGRLQCMILGLIFTGFVFFGKPFIHLWAGSGFDDSYYIALLLMFSCSVPLIQNLGIEIQRAQDKHRFRCYVYLFMAVLNVIVTIFLAQWFGAIGAAVGTAVSLIVANGLIMNIYYHKRCNIDIIRFWKSILRLSVSFIIPVAVGSVMVTLFDMVSVVEIILGILAYSSVYCLSVWFLGMNAYEKGLVKGLLGRINDNFIGKK